MAFDILGSGAKSLDYFIFTMESIAHRVQRLALAIEGSSMGRSCARLVNNIYKRVFPPCAITVGGHVFYAHTLDRILALSLLKLHGLEAGETKLFSSLAKNAQCVLDIGANLGYYSLLAARMMGPSGIVFAFEPAKENFIMLKKNIDANHYENIRSVPKAVSEVTGKVTLYVSEAHSGDHRIYDGGEKREKYEIDTVALDDFLPIGTKLDLIKMDIQGAEMLALQGMQRVLQDNPDIIIMSEFWPEGLRACGSSPEKFLSFFKDRDFQIAYINDADGNTRSMPPEQLIALCGSHGYVNLLIKRVDKRV